MKNKIKSIIFCTGLVALLVSCDPPKKTVEIVGGKDSLSVDSTKAQGVDSLSQTKETGAK